MLKPIPSFTIGGKVAREEGHRGVVVDEGKAHSALVRSLGDYEVGPLLDLGCVTLWHKEGPRVDIRRPREYRDSNHTVEAEGCVGASDFGDEHPVRLVSSQVFPKFVSQLV